MTFMITKSKAIESFLLKHARPDLAHLYNLNMECQVNVAQDNGERIEGEFNNRKWHGFTDSFTTWKSFRIPYKANTEPEYDDKEIKFDLEEHVEAVGMTGWDWFNRCSRWVAFDFDAIVGHSDKHTQKLTNEELEELKTRASEVEWVSIRRSTSGKGLHIYVAVDEVETANHNEHAALARAILGKLSALTGYDFESKVDMCGGNMWVWHRKMRGTEGLTIVKQGVTLTEVPPNWRDHVKVVTGRSRKNVPQFIPETEIDIFEELCGQRTSVKLDAEHQKVVDWLKEQEALWWWDQDHHMLVTHTHWLEQAHSQLGLRGFFKTNTESTNKDEQNCFCFPMRNGAWSIRRYTRGVEEHESWDQDGSGWTRCFLDKKPDLKTAALALGGLEDPKGGFKFREAEVASQAAELLGTSLKFGKAFGGRDTWLSQHKDGRLIASIEKKDEDRADEMVGWLPDKGRWTRIHNVHVNEPTEIDTASYDDMVRHLITEAGEDYGWMIRSDEIWRREPMSHVRVALTSLGLKNNEINTILGHSVLNCWKLVSKPFEEEYPGDREWNRSAAKLRYLPTTDLDNLSFPTWSKVLSHVGVGLTEALKENPWAKINGITCGEEYLRCWIASLFQEPTEPLPYLFLYGDQNSGKSILHEALSLLMVRGYKRADVAITSQAGYNAELEGTVVCVIEEIDLKRNAVAYGRIKDWVTSREVLIHAKYQTPYHVPNTTHWIQCSNDHNACPIFPGDTRITMCYVPVLDPLDLIPKRQLITMLEKEAPDFLASVLNLDLPDSGDRLNLPVIHTSDKELLQQLNKTAMQVFVDDHLVACDGAKVMFSEFFERFQKTLDSEEFHKWTKIKASREVPVQYPKGRATSDGQIYLGNVKWRGTEVEPGIPYTLKDLYLVQKND